MKTCIFLLLITISNICLSDVFVLTNNLIILNKDSYTIGYSEKYKQALWVKYFLNRDQLLLTTNKVKRSNVFYEDLDVPEIVSPLSYYKSGFDKGHLCPAQDRKYDQLDMNETFLMSNMSPQEPAFNRGIWKKLENYTRLTAIDHTNLVVITGPIILKRHYCLTNNIAVPQMFYKVLIDTNDVNDIKYQTFIIPNQGSDKPIESYQVPIKFFEALSGLKIEYFSTFNSNYK